MSPERQVFRKLNIYSADGKTIIALADRIIRKTALTININSEAAAATACTGMHHKELVRLANITLIGYVRGGRVGIYSRERRVKI